ncbi:MAG TPA: alpha/beta fold hydrolase [Candidatus Elarobacter sp.]
MLRFAIASLALAVVVSAAAPSAGAAPVRPPDGTYRYELRVGGTLGGRSTLVVRGTADAVTVDDTSEFTVAAAASHAVATYTAAALTPSGYVADVTGGIRPQHVTAGFAPGTVTFRSGGQSIDVPADASAPLELVGDNFTGTMVMVPAVIAAAGAQRFTLALLAGGKPVVVSVVAGPPPQRPSGVPAVDVALSVDVAGLREVYWYDPATFVVDLLAIPAQGAEFRLVGRDASVAVAPSPVPTPRPTPLPTDAPNFRSEDVSFTSADGTRLAGTLTIPNGRRRFGAVILIHGSGALDRDETIGPNKIFLQLSNAISNAGFVVLRYDKRGVGESRPAGPHTRDALLADVRAALAYARGRREVDPRRVVLLGHSEGAELAPTIAAHDARVAGVILMAAPALPLAQISMRQILAALPPDQRAAGERAETEALQKIRSTTDARNAWYRSSLDIDPAVDIARGHAPILLLQGESDIQVLPADMPRLVAAARPAHALTVKTFSGLDHLFEPIPDAEATTPQRSLAWYLAKPERIDPRVTAAIRSWLKRI